MSQSSSILVSGFGLLLLVATFSPDDEIRVVEVVVPRDRLLRLFSAGGRTHSPLESELQNFIQSYMCVYNFQNQLRLQIGTWPSSTPQFNLHRQARSSVRVFTMSLSRQALITLCDDWIECLIFLDVASRKHSVSAAISKSATTMTSFFLLPSAWDVVTVLA